MTLSEINWRNNGTTPEGSWVANPNPRVSLHAIPVEAGGWMVSATHYNWRAGGAVMENLGMGLCNTDEEAKALAEENYRIWESPGLATLTYQGLVDLFNSMPHLAPPSMRCGPNAWQLLQDAGLVPAEHENCQCVPGSVCNPHETRVTPDEAPEGQTFEEWIDWSQKKAAKNREWRR